LYGISAFWFFIGVSFGYLIFYFFSQKIKKLADLKQYYTLSDYFFDRHGKTSGYVSAVFLFFTYFLVFVIQLIGGAKILSVVSGWSYELSLSITSIVMEIIQFRN
jgi:Na+/proline symporter